MQQRPMSASASTLRPGRVLVEARRNIDFLFDRWRERWLRRVLDLRDRSQPPFPAVCYHGSLADSKESAALKSCFASALTKPSSLPAEICTIHGMSGQKYRSFINQLIASIPHPRYLEIGSWAGSTAAAALYGNRARAVCIDNWSQFGGPRSKFFANISKVLSNDIEFNLLEEDFRAVDYSQ